jgi:hypothetical protein
MLIGAVTRVSLCSSSWCAYASLINKLKDDGGSGGPIKMLMIKSADPMGTPWGYRRTWQKLKY